MDRGTSGVLIVAKTRPAYEGLVAAFQAHAVQRRYWALVEGVPDPLRATIEAPIARSAVARTRFRVDAAALGLAHPVTGERVEVEEPLAADSACALRRPREAGQGGAGRGRGAVGG
ncbi:MAG: pseudouridine synthase [Pseudonocardiaceae bacterium]